MKLISNLNPKLSNDISINHSQLIGCKAGVLQRGYKLVLYVSDMGIRHIGSSVFLWTYMPVLSLSIYTSKFRQIMHQQMYNF
jgi:hypothetical protein